LWYCCKHVHLSHVF